MLGELKRPATGRSAEVMGRKTKTKAERDYMGVAASLGCFICGMPAEIHHKTGAGMGLKASNYDIIPLCHVHHRTGGHGVAVHAGTKTWEANYGTQDEMIKRVRELVEAKNNGQFSI